jgi:phosphoribosylamine--glycine ligase
MSKRLLIIDTESSGLDVAMRAQDHGWEVIWWDKPRKDGSQRRAGEGIITKIRDYDLLRSRYLHWADLIWLTDNTAYMEMLEPFRRLGFPIYGGSVESSKWELDRAMGQQIMKEAGLNIIPGKEFNDHDSAIAYVKKHGRAFVSKPSGNADKAMSYVSDSGADLVYMLSRWKKNEKYRSDASKYGFIIQEKMRGCEMGVSGWFGPGGWCRYWEEDFEFKKLMDGDLGVNTGEQGTLLRFVEESKLADIALKPLTKHLKEIGYVGCINVNGCIDEKGEYWPYEFTMREGWPAKYNEIALQQGDPAQWMLDLVEGRDAMKCDTKNVSISIVVSIPEYPYSHLTSKETEGYPIYGAGDSEHIHLCEVMLGDAPCQAGEKVVEMPCLLTAGDYVLVATGVGETITGARKSAYTAVKKVSIPNSPGYRLDIGRSKLVEQLPKIQRLGFARGLAY